MSVALTVLQPNASDCDALDMFLLERYVQCMSKCTWKELNVYTGGLSEPSKMPGYAYSLSAHRCQVGAKLRSVPGSTCASCYALKGRYVFPNVQNAMERRLACMQVDTLSWAAAMAASIQKAGFPFFRWHDSGDLQGPNHLDAICKIATLTPNILHWLPTREYGMIRSFPKDRIPDNLIIRVSLPMVGRMDGAKDWDNYSTVDVPATMSADSYVDCPARSQGNVCGSCRACWDRTVKRVNYTKH